MLASSLALLLLYAVAVMVFWPSTGEPPWWAWPLFPFLFAAVKLWDERESVALVVGVYSGTALLLFLGYRFSAFLLG